MSQTLANRSHDEYTDEADYDTGKRCKAKLCNDSQDDDDESITKTIKPSKAVNAIEKLRELQWRRDQLERHYTFGIRRIIDEVYFPDGMINGSKKKTSSKFNERRKVSSGRSRLDEEKPILIELPCGCLHHCRRFQQDDLPSEISRRNLSSKSTLQNCTTKIKGKSCANFNCDDENSKIFRRTLSDPMETFVTNTRNDFPWPNDVPLIAVPSAPPKNTGQRIYLQKIDPDDCECDYHSYDSDMKRYKKLAKEEEKLCSDMRKINHEMNDLLENILSSQCKSEDESMESIYKSAYDKKDYPIAKYRSLMASVDSSIGAPIKPAITELKNGYRDPIRFRHCPVEIPHIETSKPVDFSRGKFLNDI
ncbi:hypothetical protein HCN44_007644 [Aphidius gifuensis]|uniref:Uncharacterized protein n=1 Tax=Aphidius gifuensis TaxID=684658 RepID=A0A834XMV7_APHGI|nr:hypothetical protein HCN44_007644 [Aphidius gifuensis]